MGIFGKKPEEETPEQQRRTEVEDLMHKYKQQIRDNLKTVGAEEISVQEVKSKVYNDFKQQYLAKHLTIYEKACNISEKILKVHPDPKLLPEYEESIDSCTVENFSVSTSHNILFKSRERGGSRYSDAKPIAFSRLEVCLMYVTT